MFDFDLENTAYIMNECEPLCTRLLQPHEYGSSEMKLAEALFRREDRISLPVNDLLEVVVRFIIECPEEYWINNHFPEALLPKEAIKSEYAHSSEGRDVAAICEAIWRYSGCGLLVFNILRHEYSYNEHNHSIFHNGVMLWV